LVYPANQYAAFVISAIRIDTQFDVLSSIDT